MLNAKQSECLPTTILSQSYVGEFFKNNSFFSFLLSIADNALFIVPRQEETYPCCSGGQDTNTA